MKYDVSYTNDIFCGSKLKMLLNIWIKTCGTDGISAEHLKHCNKHVMLLLVMRITGFLLNSL